MACLTTRAYLSPRPRGRRGAFAPRAPSRPAASPRHGAPHTLSLYSSPLHRVATVTQLEGSGQTCAWPMILPRSHAACRSHEPSVRSALLRSYVTVAALASKSRRERVDHESGRAGSPAGGHDFSARESAFHCRTPGRSHTQHGSLVAHRLSAVMGNPTALH